MCCRVGNLTPRNFRECRVLRLLRRISRLTFILLGREWIFSINREGRGKNAPTPLRSRLGNARAMSARALSANADYECVGRGGVIGFLCMSGNGFDLAASAHQ